MPQKVCNDFRTPTFDSLRCARCKFSPPVCSQTTIPMASVPPFRTRTGQHRCVCRRQPVHPHVRLRRHAATCLPRRLKACTSPGPMASRAPTSVCCMSKRGKKGCDGDGQRPSKVAVTERLQTCVKLKAASMPGHAACGMRTSTGVDVAVVRKHSKLQPHSRERRPYARCVVATSARPCAERIQRARRKCTSPSHMHAKAEKTPWPLKATWVL